MPILQLSSFFSKWNKKKDDWMDFIIFRIRYRAYCPGLPLHTAALRQISRASVPKVIYLYFRFPRIFVK